MQKSRGSYEFLLFLLCIQVQAYIISSLKKEMPSVFGKDSKKKELIANLGEIYHKIEKEHQISPGDFPKLDKMQVRFKKGKKKELKHFPDKTEVLS